MELSDFLVFILPIFFLEILAASAGSYYLKKTSPQITSTKYFVLFLWCNVCVEIFGSYAPMAYFSDYEIFSFIAGTRFENNFWLYNIYNVLSFSFLTIYFTSFLKNKYWKVLFWILTIGFIVVSAIIINSNGTFFKSSSKFVTITGTLLLFFSVILFYFELLKSDLLLQIKRFLPFYISVGILVFNLCITPIDILSQYFSIADGNELFVKLHVNVLLYANIFMYLTFIFGFLICSRKRKSY